MIFHIRAQLRSKALFPGFLHEKDLTSFDVKTPRADNPSHDKLNARELILGRRPSDASPPLAIDSFWCWYTPQGIWTGLDSSMNVRANVGGANPNTPMILDCDLDPVSSFPFKSGTMTMGKLNNMQWVDL